MASQTAARRVRRAVRRCPGGGGSPSQPARPGAGPGNSRVPVHSVGLAKFKSIQANSTKLAHTYPPPHTSRASVGLDGSDGWRRPPCPPHTSRAVLARAGASWHCPGRRDEPLPSPRVRLLTSAATTSHRSSFRPPSPGVRLLTSSATAPHRSSYPPRQPRTLRFQHAPSALMFCPR